MLLEAIQSELVRLQIHSVNLRVTTQDEQSVAFGGSLLHYWAAPKAVDAQWLLDALRALPDAAGAAVVMTAICATNARPPQSAHLGELRPAATPLDPATRG
jgi:hypothetical protein